MNSNFTGRTHRTSADAFHGADYGSAIERPVSRFTAHRCVNIALAGAIVFLVVYFALEKLA